ncbi:MAG: GtrA family protein [Pseudomonadota bacterium]
MTDGPAAESVSRLRYFLESDGRSRWVRFGFVGSLATIAHASVLYTLVELFGADATLANVPSFVVATTVAYFGHRILTFRSVRSHSHTFPRHVAVAITGLVANLAIFSIVNDVLGFNYWWAFAGVLVTVPPMTFVLFKNVAFSADDSLSYVSKIRLRQTMLAVSPFTMVTIAYTLANYIPIPFADHWDLVPMFDRMTQGTLKAPELFALHGSHWHASGYVVMLGLASLTGMSHLVEVIASLCIAAFAMMGLVRIIDRAFGGSPNRQRLYALMLLAFIFWSVDQASNWIWPWQVAVFMTIAGTIWAVERLTQERLRLRDITLAIASTTVAIYGFATAWALVPVGLGLIFWQRGVPLAQRCGQAAIWATFSALLITHFLIAQGADNSYAESVLPDLSWSSLAGLSLFVVNFVCSPITRFTDAIEFPVLVLTALLLFLSIRSALRTQQLPDRVLKPSLAFVTLALGAGGMTALGRWAVFGANQAFVGRYITFGNLFWIGTVILFVWSLRHATGAVRSIGIGFLCLLMVMKAIGCFNSATKWAGRRSDILDSAQFIAACYPELPIEKRREIAHDTQPIEPRLAVLVREEVSVFGGSPRSHDCQPATP